MSSHYDLNGNCPLRGDLWTPNFMNETTFFVWFGNRMVGTVRPNVNGRVCHPFFCKNRQHVFITSLHEQLMLISLHLLGLLGHKIVEMFMFLGFWG